MRSILLIVTIAICVSVSSGSRLSLNVKDEGDLDQPTSFCQGCRSIVSFLSQFNSSTKREDNKELFSRFCETYYPVSTDFRQGSCSLFVESVFHVLQRIDPVNFCDQVGACGENQLPGDFIGANHDGPEEVVCDFCTDVVQQAKAQLEDPRLIDDIHRKVDAFCEYLSVVDADKQCRAAIESYIDQALDFVKKMKPRDFCNSLHLCSAKPSDFAPPKGERGKVLPTLADFTDFGIETSVFIGGQQVKNVDELPNMERTKSRNCMFCKTLVKEMFKFLKTNRTEASIRNALDQGCALIYQDSDKRDHCEDLVRAYTKELLELLADETNPEVICMLLDQCTYQTKPPSRAIKSRPAKAGSGQVLANQAASKSEPIDKPITMSEFISMLDPSVEVDSMYTCVECKLFFKYLQDTIKEPTSQVEIRDWLLKNLCSNLADQNLIDSCTKLVNQESAVFFQAVAESLDPKESCKALGACSAKIRKNYLTKLNQQMTAYRNLNPLASFNGLRSTTRRPTEVTIAPPSGQLCDQCVQIVTKIDDYLSSHPIDHDIDILKDKVCNTIQNDNLRGECIMIIQTFGQEIIQAISNMDSPRQLCQKISLCSTNQ